MDIIVLIKQVPDTEAKVKVKPDTYFGVDPRKIADQNLVFYRSPANAYAFETISPDL